MIMVTMSALRITTEENWCSIEQVRDEEAEMNFIHETLKKNAYVIRSFSRT